MSGAVFSREHTTNGLSIPSVKPEDAHLRNTNFIRELTAYAGENFRGPRNATMPERRGDRLFHWADASGRSC